MFMERFCYRCKHDADFQNNHAGEGCGILSATMIYDPGDTAYPEEWVSDDDVGLVNPRCTAFEELEDVEH